MSKSPKSVIKPISGFRKFFTLKIQNLIQRYENLMSTNFPSTFRMLQMFTIGTKDFSKDVLEYMRISKELALYKSVNDLNYKELMIYLQTPKDIIKMTPFLVFTALPLAQYVTLPIAFMFPKRFLSSHYWTIDQRTRFAVEDHKKRLYYYRPVFRCLQKNLMKVKKFENESLFEKCRYVFTRLGSGTHPNIEQIIEIKSLFQQKNIYSLNSLTQKHLVCLSGMHGIRFLLLKKHRLRNHISFIQELDKVWTRDNVENDLNIEELKTACFLRGLNPINLNKNEMKQWLNMWMKISQNVDDDSLSLLLHTPIFLAYNHPSNWRLIH